MTGLWWLLWAAGAVVVAWRVCSALTEACARVDAACEAAAHDAGPDSLRLLEDLETHLKAYGEAVADYYDTTPGGPQ